MVNSDEDGSRVALHTSEPGTRLDEIVDGEAVATADTVVVDPPPWRGYRFVSFLEWVVCARLARPGFTRVTWIAHPNRGLTGVRRILLERGWELTESKDGRRRRLEGIAVPPGPRPEPRTFTTELLGRTLTFAADWGVFSDEHVDAGTALLLETAAAEIGPSPVPVVADVGTGYGPLAVALTDAGLATRVIASDADLVAVLLARMNAREREVEVVAKPDPARLERSNLTLCYMPTHTDRWNTDLLVRGLTSRTGTVLVCVHAAVEDRYLELFTEAGAKVQAVARTTHAILRFGE